MLELFGIAKNLSPLPDCRTRNVGFERGLPELLPATRQSAPALLKVLHREGVRILFFCMSVLSTPENNSLSQQTGLDTGADWRVLALSQANQEKEGEAQPFSEVA